MKEHKDYRLKDVYFTSGLAAKAKNQVEGGFLLDVVIGEGPAILQLLAGEDEALLIRGNAFLVLDLLLDVLDSVRGFNLKCDGLASQSFDEDLHCFVAVVMSVLEREDHSVVLYLPCR